MSVHDRPTPEAALRDKLASAVAAVSPDAAPRLVSVTMAIDVVAAPEAVFAAVWTEPTVLVVGDVSFYHDMNGLLAARRYDIPATIVVVNNGGGGIFHFLPIAGHQTNFEDLYGTPHGLEFGSAAELYGLRYAKVAGWDDFAACVRRGLDGRTLIVEVPGDRRRNVELHARIADAVRARVAGLASSAS